MPIYYRFPLLSFILLTATLRAATLEVGPGKTYATPCAAIAAAASGDTILIDAAGDYSGNVCGWTKNKLTLRGVNGRPKIPAAGKNAAGKGIWVISGNDTVVENIEFSGATVPDANGAGIRFEGVNLTVRNCYFHHNQNGILTNNPEVGELLVEYSEFAFNGAGSGQTHNIYVGRIAKFTLRFSYSHDAVGGHLVKTRAAENQILYNRLTTENGTTSYEMDIPNGGLSYVIGNAIQQGPNGSNSNLLAYMLEGSTPFHSNTQLYVINNTFVNDKSAGGAFVLVSTANVVPAVVKNNIFYGSGQLVSQASAVKTNNLSATNPLFVDAGGFDYRPQSGSPAIDAGVIPGLGGSQSLNPAYQYRHPACGEARSTVGAIDIGAFEFGGAGSALECVPSTETPALAALTVSPTNLLGGATATGVVSLDNPAPAGGIAVTLASSNGAVASGPSSAAIAPGSTSTSFPVTTGSVSTVTGATLTASYAGVSKSATVTVNPAPVISAVQAQAITSSAATIVWTTNVPATTTVNYGTTTAYGSSSAVDSNKVLLHSVSLSGLTPSTLYHYRAVSVDALGNSVNSSDLTFTTAAAAATYSVSLSPATVKSSKPVTISWTTSNPKPGDRIILLKADSADNTAYVSIVFTNGLATGTRTITVVARPGRYHARYLLAGTNAEVARSQTITVEAAPRPGVP